MTPTQEKIFFGLASYLGSVVLSIGAIVNSGELRWIYITFAVGVMTSAFLALLFKGPNEDIKPVIGRCGLSIMISVVGSKAVVHGYKLSGVENDALLLSALAMGVCITSYFLGHGMLKALAKNGDKAGGGFLGILMTILRTLLIKKP